MGNINHSFLYILLMVMSVSTSPNILFLVLDDLRPNLGCYRDQEAYTPNIDSLCKDSLVFENAYCQQALCAPSRNSFLTSRRPDTLKLYDFYSYWRTFSGNFTTLPQYFKENGYFTKSIGKVFHPGISSNFSDDYPYSWSEIPYHPSTEKYKNAKVCESSDKKLQKNIVCPVNIKDQPGKTLPDIQSSNEAKKFLKSYKKRQPYFLAVGFHKPHIPLKYPKRFNNYHPLSGIQLAKHRSKPKNLPDVAWNPWTDLRERDDIKKLNVSFPFGHIPGLSYSASVSYVDHLIGKIIKSVNLDETIVVLLGDHGWSLGEHGEWSKFSNFEVATKVPLVIRTPWKSSALISSPVELLDLFPTLVDLAGLPSIPSCPKEDQNILLCTQGLSLVKNRKKFAFSQYPRPGVTPTLKPNSDKPKLKDIKIMGYSVRTVSFRYTEWVKFVNMTPIWNHLYGVELYFDYFNTYEWKNLAFNSKYNDIRKTLSYALHEKFGHATKTTV